MFYFIFKKIIQQGDQKILINHKLKKVKIINFYCFEDLEEFLGIPSQILRLLKILFFKKFLNFQIFFDR